MPDRVPSGIGGLDTILAGGFIPGGITVIQGKPGAGKTILGNQICFNHAHAGGKALYVTLLAESHARMLMHLNGLAFFDQSVIPDCLYYVSAFPVLEADGLRGLLALLRREVRAHDATMLVLDGLVAAELHAGSDLEFKKFIHELQIQATVADCSMFLLTSGDAASEETAEHTMVDCVLDMRSRLYGWRSERDLEVVKRRGANHLRGRHAFAITDAGITVHPRFETVQSLALDVIQPSGPAIPSGLPQLDRMFGGGIPHRSMTMIEGPPGAGKTTLGLHFLGPCSAAEPGLLFTTSDSPETLLAKARALGLPAADGIKAGHIEVIYQPGTEGLLDAALHRLMHAVRRKGAARLCIDSLADLLELAPDPARLPAVITALLRGLRALGTTSLFTVETDNSFGQSAAPAVSGLPHAKLSGITDNIVVMRLAEQRSSLVRMISVLKARNALVDHRLRLFEIGAHGMAIAPAPGDPDGPRTGFMPNRPPPDA